MNGPAAEGSKVLVVDDNAELRALQEILLKPVYDVETAKCGEAGLNTLDHSIDVVLLDRNMPGLSGTETAVEIERSAHTPAVAIVSANPVDIDILEIPCDAYLEKPVKRPELISTIEELVLRNSHDGKLRNYFALKSKHQALKETTYGCFESTPAYKESLRELELLEKQVTASGVTGASATSD
jgi:DNA-binding response OmpR family regulator